MHIPEILQNRAYLLTLIGLVTTVATLGPFLGAEFTTQILAHEALHVAAITFAIFLTILSLVAYNSTKNTNMIFTAFAFTTFIILQIFLLEEDIAADRLEHHYSTWVDILLTVMIGFLAMGVFANQKIPTRRKYD